MEQVKILIADDVLLTLEISKAVLKDAGCRLLTASNGLKALETARRERPDLIVTDLFMPGMNGDDYCREIRNDPALSHIPVILFSSHTKLESLTEESKALFDEILAKPFGKGQFLDMISKYVHIRCRKHERYAVDIAIFYKCGSETGRGRIVNMSRGGIRIEGSQFFPRGSDIDVAILRSPVGCIELFGRIVWAGRREDVEGVERAALMGVEFTEKNQNVDETVDILTGQAVNPALQRTPRVMTAC